jgi:hypothetical protein
MKTSQAVPVGLGLINKVTGQVVASVPAQPSDYPEFLPPGETIIWHYIPVVHFKTLLETNLLYLTRIDEQDDPEDGTYTSANLAQWSPLVGSLMKKIGNTGPPPEHLLETNRVLRQRSFIHCWTMRRKESVLMWEECSKGDVNFVAIRTTIAHLQKSLANQDVRIVRVPYGPGNKPGLDFSYSAPLMAKRSRFVQENEIRVLSMNEVESPLQPYKQIHVETKILIQRVVVHPESAPAFRDAIRQLLKRFKIGAHVAKSEKAPSDLSAYRKNR